jgi:hypothetical protein
MAMIPDVEISFDRKKKTFCLTIPISSKDSAEIRRFVQERERQVFRPHATRFDWKDNEVVVMQEVPFADEDRVRLLLIEFYRLASRCRELLDLPK